MLHILGFLAVFIIVILVAGLTIIGGVLRAIFGFGRRSSSNHTSTGNGNQQQYRTSSSNNNEEEIITERDSASKPKKIFTKDEGEYVDFEEVKDDTK